jgi:multimeric flavodoxin WrbA
MKVLGIVSSPRKNGNGQTLVEQALAGAAESGAQTELIRLVDLEINPCLDCGFCKAPGHDTCVQKDGMQMLYQKLAEADAVIFGMPVYFGRPNAPFLQFIDRLYAMAAPDFSSRLPKDKKYAAVITLGGGGLETVTPIIDSLDHVFAGMFGWENAGYIWQNMLHDKTAVSKMADKLAEAKEFGRKLV